MDVLQSSISELPDYDINMDYDLKESNIARAVVLMSKIPTIVRAWDRIEKGCRSLTRERGSSTCGEFSDMLRGKEPNEEESKIFDICLILHAEHSFTHPLFARSGNSFH